jgi:hypothetical protein
MGTEKWVKREETVEGKASLKPSIRGHLACRKEPRNIKRAVIFKIQQTKFW